MMSNLRASLLWWLPLAALGCGGVTSALSTDAGGPGGDAPVGETSGETSGNEGRINEACAAVAKAMCDKRAACSGKLDATGVGVIRLFGTMAECLARSALQCGNAFRAPGSGHSLATEQQCVDAFVNYSCADFFAGNVPPSCEPAGARVNGTACAFNAQCKSGFCTGERKAACGTCAPEPAVNDSCAASDCGHGQYCDATTTTCKTPGGAGDACDSTDDCGYGLVCQSSAAAGGSGTCKTAAATVGAACGGTMPVCDGAQGLFCAGPAGSKTCVATTFVGDGAPCGVVSMGYAGCAAGACYTAKGQAGAAQPA